MKLVFTAEEVSAALQISTSEFERVRSSLEASGFPRPISGLDDRWSIMDVINWVNRGCEDLSGTSAAQRERSYARLS